jgi:hypothetical protein
MSDDEADAEQPTISTLHTSFRISNPTHQTPSFGCQVLSCFGHTL